MESQHGMVSLPQVRERVVQQLTEAFTNDLISVEELEDRLEHVYRSKSAAEAEGIVADLRSAAATGSLPAPNVDEPRRSRDEVATGPSRDRVVAILSSSRRSLASAPHRLELLSVMSESTLDLTTASLPGDIVDIHVRVVMASVRIIVPAGLRVVNRVGAFVANIETDSALDLAPMAPGTPVIRITGYATMANLEIVAGPTGEGPRP